MDWSDRLEKSKEKYQRLRLAQSAPYKERLERYKNRRSAFENAYVEYEAKVLPFNNRADGGDLQEITEPESLTAWKKNLKLEQTALNSLLPKLHQEYEATKATDFAGRFRLQADLDQLLTESEELAREAVDILAEHREPNLYYLALCNFAQILRAKSNREDNKKAVMYLEQAVELIREPQSATFGHVNPALFFTEYHNLAFEPLIDTLKEIGDHDDARRFEQVLEKLKDRPPADWLIIDGRNRASASGS